MIRFLLWIFVIYIVWKLIDTIVSSKNSKAGSQGKSKRPDSSSSDFSNVEDAEYEDITPKPPPEKKSS